VAPSFLSASHAATYLLFSLAWVCAFLASVVLAPFSDMCHALGSWATSFSGRAGRREGKILHSATLKEACACTTPFTLHLLAFALYSGEGCCCLEEKAAAVPSGL